MASIKQSATSAIYIYCNGSKTSMFYAPSLTTNTSIKIVQDLSESLK